MESATAAVRSASLARARSALVYGGARGARRVVGAGPAAARARRRALVAVAVASHHQEHLEPLPSRAQEGGAVAVTTTQVSRVGPESCARVVRSRRRTVLPLCFGEVFFMQDDEAEVHANDAAAVAAETETSSPQLGKSAAMVRNF
jgi:hypothetical protein